MHRRHFLSSTAALSLAAKAHADSPLPTVTLGKSGLKVTKFCVGGFHMRVQGEDEGVRIINGVTYTGFIGGNYYFGTDLNGDGDLLDTCRIPTTSGSACSSTASASNLPFGGVTLLAPSQTRTKRVGVISGLRWDINDANTVRFSYTYDHANHRQTGELLGKWPLLDLLFVGYLLPGIAYGGLAFHARGRRPMPYVIMLALTGVALAFAWVTLSVRRYWHGEGIADWKGFLQPETYTYSVVWLLLGVLLLAVGSKFDSKSIRLASAGLVLIAVTVILLVRACSG